MELTRRNWLLLPALSLAATTVSKSATQAPERDITIWHGDSQRVGHLGDAQDDFNLMGHIAAWREIDTLDYRINGAASTPLAFRAYRRLVEDGDFNADVPIGRLQPGSNTIEIVATYRDGEVRRKTVTVERGSGLQRMPLRTLMADLRHFQEIGQAVDGHWGLTPQGLRTRQVGYDRVFLIGERNWQDYDVLTHVTIHAIRAETTPISGGNGLGMIARFAGHVSGGPRYFPSGQPKWGYQPFGAIGWLRWTKGKVEEGPHAQFYPGDGDRSTNKQHFPIVAGETYGMRLACTTMPDTADGAGVTHYQYKVWLASLGEPADWTYEHTQTSRISLRRGGIALLAHHVDATFVDVEVNELVGQG